VVDTERGTVDESGVVRLRVVVVQDGRKHMIAGWECGLWAVYI
jgi:uncharacterized protein YqkB